MGLVVALVGAYLWYGRRRLRFPRPGAVPAGPGCHLAGERGADRRAGGARLVGPGRGGARGVPLAGRLARVRRRRARADRRGGPLAVPPPRRRRRRRAGPRLGRLRGARAVGGVPRAVPGAGRGGDGDRGLLQRVSTACIRSASRRRPRRCGFTAEITPGCCGRSGRGARRRSAPRPSRSGSPWSRSPRRGGRTRPTRRPAWAGVGPPRGWPVAWPARSRWSRWPRSWRSGPT